MSIRVLIVDDAPFIREVLASALKEEGYNVIGFAQDGAEAVKMSESLRPDLILMDIIMPHKTGLQATVQILDQNPNIKILACSTIDDDVMINKAYEAGCVGYIKKPFEKNSLLKTIRQATSL
jgi:two-component system, chemotaxis family, chemotaxis protein CheY